MSTSSIAQVELYEGYLHRKSNKGLRRWKKRYFIWDGGLLTCYESERPDTKILHSYRSEEIKRMVCPNKGYRPGFYVLEIEFKNKKTPKLILAAKTSALRGQWMRIISLKLQSIGKTKIGRMCMIEKKINSVALDNNAAESSVSHTLKSVSKHNTIIHNWKHGSAFSIKKISASSKYTQHSNNAIKPRINDTSYKESNPVTNVTAFAYSKIMRVISKFNIQKNTVSAYEPRIKRKYSTWSHLKLSNKGLKHNYLYPNENKSQYICKFLHNYRDFYEEYALPNMFEPSNNINVNHNSLRLSHDPRISNYYRKASISRYPLNHSKSMSIIDNFLPSIHIQNGTIPLTSTTDKEHIEKKERTSNLNNDPPKMFSFPTPISFTVSTPELVKSLDTNKLSGTCIVDSASPIKAKNSEDKEIGTTLSSDKKVEPPVENCVHGDKKHDEGDKRYEEDDELNSFENKNVNNVTKGNNILVTPEKNIIAMIPKRKDIIEPSKKEIVAGISKCEVADEFLLDASKRLLEDRDDVLDSKDVNLLLEKKLSYCSLKISNSPKKDDFMSYCPEILAPNSPIGTDIQAVKSVLCKIFPLNGGGNHFPLDASSDCEEDCIFSSVNVLRSPSILE